MSHDHELCVGGTHPYQAPEAPSGLGRLHSFATGDVGPDADASCVADAIVREVVASRRVAIVCETRFFALKGGQRVPLAMLGPEADGGVLCASRVGVRSTSGYARGSLCRRSAVGSVVTLGSGGALWRRLWLSALGSALWRPRCCWGVRGETWSCVSGTRRRSRPRRRRCGLGGRAQVSRRRVWGIVSCRAFACCLARVPRMSSSVCTRPARRWSISRPTCRGGAPPRGS